MIVLKIEPQYIDVLWPYVEPLLKKPMERTLDEITLNDVKDWLKTNLQQLWLGVNEEKEEIVLAFTTQVHVYPKQSHLRIHLTGAKDHTINNWIDSWIEPVETYCKQNGIRYIETGGRDGWTKILKDKGYKKYYTVLAKEIKDD